MHHNNFLADHFSKFPDPDFRTFEQIKITKIPFAEYKQQIFQRQI